MTMLLAGLVWVCIAGSVLLVAFRQFTAHRAGTLRSTEPARPVSGGVTIIVPVRNEMANICACLRSLSAQAGVDKNMSVMVVDDESRDGTAAAVSLAALADPRIRLVGAGPLPPGWLGKPHACWIGALQAETEWLCFIDADVRAEPDLLRAAIAAAEQQSVAMLSLTPFQELGSFWERLIIPAGMMLLACTMDLRRIDDPAAPEISANGQFLLVRRTAYFAAGGHLAVRHEVCEDKALAARIKRGGGRFRLLGAEHLARTRMYTDLSSLRQGLTKNATEFIGDGFSTVAAGVAGAVVAWAALLLPALISLAVFREPTWAAAAGALLALAGSAVVVGVHCGTLRYFQLPLGYGLLLPFGYTAAAVLACESALRRRQGSITWKGRRYDFERGASSDRP